MLAENVEGIANATETVEMLNQAQENLQEANFCCSLCNTITTAQFVIVKI